MQVLAGGLLDWFEVDNGHVTFAVIPERGHARPPIWSVEHFVDQTLEPVQFEFVSDEDVESVEIRIFANGPEHG